MRNNYFETMDERVLVECSVEKLVQETKYEECLQIVKDREKQENLEESKYNEQREPTGGSPSLRHKWDKWAADVKSKFTGNNEMFDGLLKPPERQ